MQCLGVTGLKGKAPTVEYQAQDNVYLRVWGEGPWRMRQWVPICSCLLFREHCPALSPVEWTLLRTAPCVPHP